MDAIPLIDLSGVKPENVITVQEETPRQVRATLRKEVAVYNSNTEKKCSHCSGCLVKSCKKTS